MARNDFEMPLDVSVDEGEPFDPANPERNLLAAVLLSAVADLHKPGDENRRAIEFFMSVEEDYVFSFRSICSFLNIDPSKVLQCMGLPRSG